jgi:hypothetical protein
MKNFKLENPTKEELENFNKELKELLDKNNLYVRAVPYFVPTTEGKFVIDTTLNVYKKGEEIIEEAEIKKDK